MDELLNLLDVKEKGAIVRKEEWNSHEKYEEIGKLNFSTKCKQIELSMEGNTINYLC